MNNRKKRAVAYQLFLSEKLIGNRWVAVIATVLAVMIAGRKADATDYSWSTANSGTWTNSGLWTPSGYPNAASDNATIAATGAAYTVNLSSNITVASLTLNSGSATLLDSGGTFSFVNTFLNAGTFTLNGGTLFGGIIHEAGGTLNVQSGTLSNLSITGGALSVNGNAHIAGSLSVANHNVNLAASSTLFFNGQSVDNLNITPATYGYIYPEYGGGAPTTLTFGSGVIVHGGVSFQNYNNDALINNGVLNADNATYPTSINLSYFTNNGTAEATAGGTLNINAGSWENFGTILASSGTVTLNGSFGFANTGTLNGAAGTISIGGTLVNTSSTVTLNSTTGNVILNGGTISGGTIAEAASGVGTLNVQSGTLSSVSITGNDLNVNGSLHIAGTLAIADHNLKLANSDGLFFNGQSVDNLNITPATYGYIYPEYGGGASTTLTFGSGVTVHGGVSFQNYNSDALINNGLLNADSAGYPTSINLSYFTNNGTAEASNSGTLNINANSWSNAGTILASGGTVNLNGSFTFANTGTLNGSAGTISIGGTLSNIGSTVTLNSTTGNVVLGGGTISGGTIAEAASGVGTLNVQAGTLSNVSITGNDLNVKGNVHIAGSLSIADHNVKLAATSTLFFNGQSVDNLNITPATYGYIYPEYGGGAPTTLTFGSGVIVHGGVSFQNYNNDALINNGLLNADSATNPTSINLSYFTNNGTAEASNSGTLNIYANSWVNAGTLLASGGTVNLNGSFTFANTGTLNGSAGTISIGGTLSNIGSTVTLNSTTGNVVLGGGTISGGTIAQAASGVGTLNVQSGTLSNVAITGNDLNDNGNLHIAGTLSIADHNLKMSSAASLFFNGQSVDNLNITPTTYGYIYPEYGGGASTVLTFGSGVIVHGGVSFQNYNNDSLINNGLLNADSKTYPSSINLSSFTNNGTAEASNGGTLNIYANSWVNAGTLLASGGLVNLNGSFTFANTGTLNGSTGTISIGGTLSNIGSTVTLNTTTGNVVLGGGTISGGTIAQAASGVGTLNVQAGTLSNVSITGNDLNVNSNVHLVGTLSIADHNLKMATDATVFFNGQGVDNLNITPTSYGYIYPEYGGGAPTTLTFGSGVIVHGGVSFQNYNNDALINNGVLNADSTTYPTSVNLSYFTNNATAEATNGGSLVINSQVFTNTGRLYVNNGTIVDNNLLTVGTGSLGGSGTINASVSLNTTSSVLSFNLGGATKGSGYDSLLINGNLSLGGNLKLYLINGFKPLATQMFTIVATANSGTITNSFLNAANGGVLDTSDGTGAFTVTINANQIVLSNYQSVPEPTGAALLGISAIGLLRRRRTTRFAVSL